MVYRYEFEKSFRFCVRFQEFHLILVVHCFWQSLFERIWNNDVTMAARDFSFLNFGARLEEALQVANSVDVNKSMLRWTVAKASILFSIVPFTSNFFLVGRSLFVSVVPACVANRNNNWRQALAAGQSPVHVCDQCCDNRSSYNCSLPGRAMLRKKKRRDRWVFPKIGVPPNHPF